MSNYIPATEVEIIFQGDTVHVEIEGLEYDDFSTLLPYFKENDEGKTVLRFEDKEKFQKTATALLGKYVTKLEGLKDAKGNPVTLETVLSKVYFIEFSMKLMEILFENSFVSPDEEKKSDEPSAQGSKDSSSEMI